MAHSVFVDEAHMSRVARLTPFLWGDQDHPSPGSDERQVFEDEIIGCTFGHVLDDVSEEHGVEAVAHSKLAFRKRGGLECPESCRVTRANALSVVVDTDTVAIQMLEVASNPTTDIEHETRAQVAKVPAVRALRIQDAADPSTAC